MSKIKVAVVDDHKIIRDGIISLFKNDEELEISQHYENGKELLEGLKAETFDVVLLDMHMPEMDGIETARQVLEIAPGTKVLIHTMSEMVDEIEQIVRLGAHGYILKNAGQEELATAIKIVAHGSSYFSTRVMNSFITSCLGSNDNPLKNLSPEEGRILAMVCTDDFSNYQLSLQLNMSEEELNIRIANIKRKLNLETDIALGKFCARYCKELEIYLEVPSL